MKNSILEAIEEGSKILSSETDKEYRTRVNETMQLLLKALKTLESNKL